MAATSVNSQEVPLKQKKEVASTRFLISSRHPKDLQELKQVIPTMPRKLLVKNLWYAIMRARYIIRNYVTRTINNLFMHA